jgi:hypothetical protein
MKLKTENLNATGKVQIQRFNKFGVLEEERSVSNLVVTTGKNYIAEKMVATTNTPISMTHMAIGTNTATPEPSNSALGAQTGRVSLSGSSVSNNSITYTATFPSGTGTGAITEAGVFNASTAGTMLCRTTFPVVNKASGDTIAITWVVTIS